MSIISRAWREIRQGSVESVMPGTDVLERASLLGIDANDRSFAFAGRQYYGIPSDINPKTERIEPGFLNIANGGMKGNAVVFACIQARMSVFSEARFQFRRIKNGRPGDLFGTADLAALENPWPNGTTGDLLARMLLDADLAGNSYWTLRNGSFRRLRPDWVYIVRGVPGDSSQPVDAIESTVLGYLYWPGGFAGAGDPEVLMPDEVCHFAPIPDPEAAYKGMSWITPVLRELNADNAATDHKMKFFENGATLQYVIRYDPTLDIDTVRAMKEMFDEHHRGTDKAYRVAHIGGGADLTTVGADLRQLDFKQVQGAGETRIAAAARVPPIIVGLSEGLQAATYSNYAQARRAFADNTLRPLWRNAAASLASLIVVPGGSMLWYDDRDIAFLRDDRQEAAQILQINASTMQTLISSGFKPESVTKAMLADGDWSMLEHTGLFSVQLQPPTTPEDVAKNQANAAALASGATGQPVAAIDNKPVAGKEAVPAKKAVPAKVAPTQRKTS